MKIKKEQIDKICENLKAGDIIAYPTDTVYGLGCDAFNDHAILKLKKLKGREKDKPISILVSDMKMLKQVVSSIPPASKVLMKKYWPGKVTILLRKKRKISSLLTGKSNFIGVRISSHPWVNQLIRAYGRPITSTSANLSGCRASMSGKEVRHCFGQKVIIVSGGRLKKSVGSTIIIVSQNKIKIVRQGDVQL